jgi:hypothetical protein
MAKPHSEKKEANLIGSYSREHNPTKAALGYATREAHDEEEGKRYVKNSVQGASVHDRQRLQSHRIPGKV